MEKLTKLKQKIEEVMEEKLYYHLEDVFIAYHKEKEPFKFGISGNDINLLKLWQLNKNLSEQSKETINFLYDLICK